MMMYDCDILHDDDDADSSNSGGRIIGMMILYKINIYTYN